MFTSGKKFFKDVLFPIYYEKNDYFNSIQYRDQRLVISFIKKGSAVLNCNSKNIILSAPAILLINERASISLEEHKDFHSDSIYFHPSFVNFNLNFENIRKSNPELNYTEQQDLYLFDTFAARNDSMIVIPLNTDSVIECDILFKKFYQAIHYKGDNYCPCWIRAVLISLLIFLLDIDKTSIDEFDLNMPSTDYHLKDIILFLYSHYGEDLTIEGIASRFGTNRTTLNKRFNKIVGCTVIRFLRNIRINVAAKYLRTTSKTITEIGLDAGFQDISNFCKLFKETFGCTPNNYRSMNRQTGYNEYPKIVADDMKIGTNVH